MVTFGVQKCSLSGVFFGPRVKKCKKRNFFLWGSDQPEEPPKGVKEKNGNGIKNPLSPHFLEKISTLSFRKLFISIQNTSFIFSLFSF